MQNEKSIGELVRELVGEEVVVVVVGCSQTWLPVMVSDSAASPISSAQCYVMTELGGVTQYPRVRGEPGPSLIGERAGEKERGGKNDREIVEFFFLTRHLMVGTCSSSSSSVV